jgi:hypothetical protein
MEEIKFELLNCWHNGVFYEEEFRDLPEFDGNYQISNFGRLKSKGRIVQTSTYKRKTKDRLLKLKTNQDGYFTVSFTYLAKVNSFSFGFL